MTNALQSRYKGLLRRQSEWEAAHVEAFQRSLNANMDGSPQRVTRGSQIDAELRQLRSEIDSLSYKIAEIILQLAIVNELPLIINIIFQATQKMVARLETAVKEREAKHQVTLEFQI